MDRDLGRPKKSQASTGMFAGLTCAPAGLPMKQIGIAPIRQAPPAAGLSPTTPVRQTTRTAAPSKAHDKDGTFSKEIYR